MSLRTFLTQVLQLLKGERREQPVAAAVPRPAARPIRFTRLEDRRVFNASFVLNAAGLTVDNFTAPGALQVSEGPGDLQFQLGSGMGEWIGNTAPGISILNNGTLLSVQESLLQGPGQSGNLSIFAESPQGDVDVFVNDAISLSTGSTAAQFSIHSDGNVLLTHATRGPNPILDAPDHQIRVTAAGRIDIGGIVHGKSVELDAGGDILVAGRVDSRSWIQVKSLAEILDGQIEQVSFRGDLLDFTAAKGIGNADTLETDVRSLTAINTSEGTIDITETGTPGNLTIGRIENIGRSVRLQVDGGSLIDGNDLAGIQTNIQARDLFLQIGQDIGSSGPNPFPLFRNHIDVLLSGNLTATAPGFGAFSGRIDGQLAVQAHDLTLASLNDVDFTRAAQSSLQGLALIADLDGNGSGTVLIGDQLSLPESLLIQGADVQASDGTIDLSAGRILFVSGQSEDVHLNLLPGQTGQPGQFDGRVTGNLEITADSAVALADLDGNGQALQSTVPGGSLKLTAAGDVLVQGKVSAAGSISLSAGGSMRVFGVIDPDTVTLTAADDLVISGAVSAATSLQIVAGTDGTGSLLTTSTAFVEAGVPGIPGVLLLRSGDREGNTELNGTVRARGAITVAAAGGSINGSTELSAPQLSLQSLAGIGNPAPLRIRAAAIDADSVTNGIFLKNSLAATYTSLSSGSGSIIVESEPSADIVSAFAGTGSLRFSTVDGDLQVQQAITEVGNIVLLSGGQGLVLVGNAIAGGQIRIQSGTAVAELDDDPDADLRGHQIAIQAVTGIGTAAGAIEVDGIDLTLAALTATGDIHLQALENVFVGQVAEFQGLRISDPGDMNPATSISLGAGGVISVVSSIENLAHGQVALTAGQDIFQEAPTRIVTGGNGLISLIAGVSQQGSLPGSIQMTEGAVISSQQGQISLRAAGDVVLAEVLSLSGDISIEAGNGGAIGSIVDNSVEETLNLATNGLLTLRASTNIGGPDSQQDLNVQVFGLQATAGSGGIYVRSADFLRIHKSGLQTLGDAGDILVTTAAGGIEVDGRIEAAGIGRIDLTAAGDLKTRFGITSEAGSIRLAARRIEAEVAGDISTGGDGSISLQALNSEILMNSGVAFNAQNGDITLQAATQVLVSDLNTTGNVSITAAQGRLIDNNDTPTTKRTNITAADVKLKADSIEQRPVDFFTGLPDALEVSISGNLSVSVQQFAALQGSIAGTDLLEAETLFLMSAGNLGFSTVNPSVTNLALLADVDGNNNGTLFFSTPVAVSGDLRISGADIDAGSPGINLTARNVLLQSGQSESVRLTLNDPGTGLRGSLDARSGGALDITASTAVQLRDLDGSGQALASTSGTGSLKLQADGAIRVDGKIFTGSDVVLVSSADIVINDAIDPTSITITAADDITISGLLQATSLISVSAGSDGSGDLQATAEAGMRAGSSSAGTGTIRLTAGQNSGNIQLQGTVQAGSLLVIAAASGSVNGTAQLESGILDIDAGTGIGNKQPLQVLVNSLSADTQTGDIRIVSNQPAIASSLTSGAGSIDFRGFGPTEVQVASTGEGHLSIEITRGQLTAGQITAPLGSVFLHTIETGSIVVDAVAAGQSILADSADSITEADEDPEADLHSTGIALAAVHRIGSAGNPLELDGIELQLAAQSDDAAIQLAALNSISVGNVLNRSGLVIRNASGTAAPAGIRLTSAGRVLLDTDVVNHSRGDIWLQADGDLQQRSGSAVRTFDGGTIMLQAGAPRFGSQGGLGNSITQDDGTTINAHHGKISLQATGDIRIASLASIDGSMVLSAGGTLTPGAIVDNSLSENPNLTTAGTVSLSATASIGGPAPAEDINLNVTALEASSTFGSIHLRSIGSVRLHGMGLRTANAAGNIELTTDAGPIDAAAEVHAANAGNIALRAAEQLILRKSITSDSGFITLNGSRVFAEAAGDVTTGQFGSIVLNAFTEDIVLDQDASLTAGNGFISLQASRSIFLSRLTTNGNVVAVSVSGDIIDANDNSAPRTLNITANNLTLTAANIGAAVGNFFTDLPDGLEVDLTGTLTVQAQSFAALLGSINGTGSLAAETLFLMSDQNIVFSTPALPLVTNLALLAGSDGGGPGTLTLQNPVAVTGNFRISAGDIDGGTSGTRLTARNLLLESGQSEQIRIELNGPSANQPGRLDARSAADLQIIAAGDVELQDLDGSGTALASSLATGNLMLDASGRLRVSGKVLTQGNIVLTSGADIVVDAPVDPDNITISAADDITINSHIAANRLVKISAGDDGTGDLLTTTASLIEAGGTAANGDMTLSAGNTSGEIRLNGTVRATDSLTVSALGGSINGSSELTARFLAMRAATGIGNTAPLRLNAGTVSAESLNGDISLTSNTAAVYSTVSTGTGSVTLRSNAAAEIQQITSQEGNIAVIGESAPIFLDTAVAGGSGNLTIENGNGDLQINNLQAVDNRIVIAAGSVSEFLSDSAADLTASRILLQTTAGVGTSGKALDLTGSGLQLTAATQSGSLLLAAAGSVMLSSSDGIDGLQLGSAGQATGDPNGPLLSLTATGDMTISAAVRNFLGGDVRLLADGQILQQAQALVTAINAGSIQVQARGNGSGIRMNSGSTMQAGDGQIRLTADSDILLALLRSTGAVTVQSISGGIVDNNDDGGIARSNVVAKDLLLQAIFVAGPPADFFNGLPQPLELSLTGRLSVEASDYAVLQGTSFETDSLRAETLFLISDDHLTISGTDPKRLGSLALIADADNDGVGTITLRQPVMVADKLRLQAQSITAGSQVIDLSARQILVRSGTAQLLQITPTPSGGDGPEQFDGRTGGALSVLAKGSLNLVDLDGDFRALTADGDIMVNARNQLATGSDVIATGSVELIADGRLQVDAAVRGTELRLTSANDDARISGSLLGSQSVSLRAGLGTAGGIAVTSTGRIIAGNSTSTGTIQLSSGSITGDQLLEGRLEAGERITVDAPGGRISGTGQLLTPDVVLNAGTGIGSNLPLQLTASRITAESADGVVHLTNSRDGQFTRLAAREGAVIVTGHGNTLIDDALTVNGSISLTAIDGDLTVRVARQQNSGSISLATLSSGTVRVGQLRSPETLSITAASSIEELQSDSDNDLEASSMALQARTGIGTSANSIELGGPNLQLAALSQSGGIFLTSSEETTISDVADLSGLQIADSSPQVAGNIQFTSRGSMTIESSVVNSSGGNITLQSGNHLRVLPSVAINTVGSGTLTLRAGERPAGDISINFGSLSLENDTVISTEHGNITLTAAASVTLYRVQSIDGDLLIRAAVTNSEGRLEGDSSQDSAHISTRGFASLFAGTTDANYVASLTVDVGSLEGTWSGGSLRLNSVGPLTIDGSGLRTSGPRGDIDVLVNRGELTVAGEVSAASSGQIRLISEDGVKLLSSGRISATGDGSVFVSAEAGSVLMHATAGITSENGDVTITAADNLQIARILSQLGSLTLTAIGGAISDATPDETLNLATAGSIWLRAGSGIGGGLSGQDLNLSAGQLDAVSGSNGIHLTSPGSLIITRQGLISAGTNADIQVRSAGQLFAQRTLRSDTGDVTVSASGIVLETDSEILALAGHVLVTAESEGLFMAAGSGGIQGSGNVTVRAASDLVAGRIAAGNTLTVTSLTGTITDNNDTSNEQLLNLSGDAVILDAAAGIGAEDALEISARTAAAVNRTSGDVRLVQVASAGNLGLQLIDNGDRLVSLTVAGGALTDANDSSTIARLNLQAGEARLTARQGIGPGNALETRIATLTAMVTDGGNIELHELDSLQIDSLQLTGPGSILIQADQDLLVQDRVQALPPAVGSAGGRPQIRLAAAENLRLAAGAQVTSAASHDIILAAVLDVSMQTGSSVKSAGGDLLISTDTQHRGHVLVQTLETSGTRISINSGGDIRIGDAAAVRLQATNGDPTRSEQIVIDAAGDIRVADGVLITTDGDPTARASANQTDDRLLLIARGRTAGSNQPLDSAVGRVQFDGRVTLRTDGGVATTFLGRPAANATITTAFFDASKAETSPQGRLVFPGLLRPDPNGGARGGSPGDISLQIVFEVQITSGSSPGVPAEENLRLDIDWRDPSDSQPSTLYVNPGRQQLGHSYSLNELLRFLDTGKSQFLVDFSVSHHESIRVFGGEVQQGAAFSAVPVGRVRNPVTGSDLTTGLISSSDSAATGALQPGQPSGPRDVFSDPNSNADFHFDGAVVRIQVPVSPFAGGPFNGNGNGPGNGNRGNGDSDQAPFQRPPRRAFIPLVQQQPPAKIQAKPQADFQPAAAPLILSNNSVQQEAALEDSLAVTEDIYEVRQSEQGRYTVLRQLDKFEQGEELLNPQALKAWVFRQSQQIERPLLDGEDYELWLVTKKRTAAGSVVRIERQLLMFDVIEGQPFPARDDQAPDQPETLPQLQAVPPEPLPPQPPQPPGKS